MASRMNLTPAVICQRAERARAEAELWRTDYEDAYKFGAPQRNLYDGYYEAGTKAASKTAGVYSSVAANSTKRFANRLQDAIFSADQQWCRLKPGVNVAAEDEYAASGILSHLTDVMFSLIHQSGFDDAMSQFLIDLAVGTACMIIHGQDDENQPLRFEAVPPKLISLESGAHGKISNVYREMKLRGEIIPQQWPDSKIPEDLISKWTENPGTLVTVLEATIWDPETRRFAVRVILPDEGKIVIDSRDLKSNPWIITRYAKLSGENYGRGPLLDALPDIRSENLLKKFFLQNANLAIAGIYTYTDDGVLNLDNVKGEAGAFIKVQRNKNDNPSITPLKSSANFNIAEFTQKTLEAGIKKALLDDTLPPDTSSARSATEISHRFKELAQALGPAYGRIIQEAMIPIIKRVLFLMNERGIVNLGGLDFDGKFVEIVATSRLSQVGDIEKAEKLIQASQMLGGGAFGAAGTLVINQERAAKEFVKLMNIPPEALNSDDEMEAAFEELQAQMEQQQQMQAQGQEQEAIEG